MSYEKLLKKYMEEIKPEYTCEWGSGESTKIILSYDFVKAHVVIEHDIIKVDVLKKNITDSRLFIYCVPDLELYPLRPKIISKDLAMEFKLIFINGEEKLRCLQQTKEVLHFFGVVLLTDAQKMMYMETMNKLFPKQKWDRPEKGPATIALQTWKY